MTHFRGEGKSFRDQDESPSPFLRQHIFLNYLYHHRTSLAKKKGWEVVEENILLPFLRLLGRISATSTKCPSGNTYRRVVVFSHLQTCKHVYHRVKCVTTVLEGFFLHQTTENKTETCSLWFFWLPFPQIKEGPKQRGRYIFSRSE